MRRLAVAVMAIVLALAASPAAFAQSAGDDQYQDPFAGADQGGGGEPEQQETDTGSSVPAAPAPPTAAAPAPAPAPTAAATSAETSGTLPYTGLPAAVLAVSGAALLAGGLALRRQGSRKQP